MRSEKRQIYSIVANFAKFTVLGDEKFDELKAQEWYDENWASIYFFLTENSIVKNTHIYASSVVLKTDPSKIGMSLDSDGSFKFVKEIFPFLGRSKKSKESK